MEGGRDGRSCDKTRARSEERGKSMNEGVVSSRPLLTPQPGGPRERARQGRGWKWGRFRKGGDIDVAKRRGMGGSVLKKVRRRREGQGHRVWGLADHPRTV